MLAVVEMLVTSAWPVAGFTSVMRRDGRAENEELTCLVVPAPLMDVLPARTAPTLHTAVMLQNRLLMFLPDFRKE